jgi:hypothetical protein
MGEKIPSVRTLPSGEKVIHYPDGNQVLIPSGSPIDDFLDSNEESIQAANDLLTADRIAAITDKRESLDAGTPVPHDKRVI